MSVKDTKFISDVNIKEKNVIGKKPFKVCVDDNRSYVRLEISAPMTLNVLKDIFGNFNPGIDNDVIKGSILNISSGGVLVESEEPLNEGDILAMRFMLQESETIDNVLGIVKRCDTDEFGTLTGIAFVDREHLLDKMSSAELDLLSAQVTNFQDSINKVLNQYLSSEVTIE